jgi:signal transduction histidine kinase
MKIKTKIQLGLLFLLTLILMLAFTSSFYIYKLSSVSSAILKDNYESIEYTKNMIQALDEGDDSLAIKRFEENLVKQEHNITEIGENEATNETRQLFELYKSGMRDSATESKLRQKILLVEDLNMQAMLRKNETSIHTTKNIFSYITLLGTMCFLMSFTLALNFPSMIANPIVELTEGIRGIIRKNYSQRLHFSSKDEFGEVAAAFNSMAVLLDQYENSNLKKLLVEKKRIETVINNFKDAVIGLDEKNHVIFANSVALSILGISESDIIGKYAPDVALNNDLLRTLLQNYEKDKLLKIFADNKESYFIKEVLDIVNENNNIGQVFILRNITRFQELDVAKTNFIATISHELKTPISSIKMSLKLIQDGRVGKLNEEQNKLIEDIKEDSQRLLKITGELLDLAQVESGNIQLSLAAVRPIEIIEQAVRSARTLADLKSIHIEVQTSNHIADVYADPDKASWVLLNLITNAIRYSSRGAKIIVSAVRIDDQIEFAVQDFGRGIEEKYLSKVFDKFFQVPGAANEGTGMGLAISKEIIEKHNGTISVTSEYGKGSRFSFSLMGK